MGQVHIDADHQLKRPFGAFFHGDCHIFSNPPFNLLDFSMRFAEEVQTTVYDFQNYLQDENEDNFEDETRAYPL